MKEFWKDIHALSRRLAAAPRLLAAFDFDGTLSALAESPGAARLTPEFRAALKELAASPGVKLCLISGRELKDLRRLVGLRGAYYCGNHGIELAGPGLRRRDLAALKERRLLEKAAAEIRDCFPPATGVLVEDKFFSLSVHYRGLGRDFLRGFFTRMRTLTGHYALRWRKGHKVLEALPRGAPHKGNALELLSKRLRAGLVLAVGDDLTDEDMFRAVGRGGIAVRVGRRTASAAAYYLRGQPEVLRLLRCVAAARGRGMKWKEQRRNRSDSAPGSRSRK